MSPLTLPAGPLESGTFAAIHEHPADDRYRAAVDAIRAELPEHRRWLVAVLDNAVGDRLVDGGA